MEKIARRLSLLVQTEVWLRGIKARTRNALGQALTNIIHKISNRDTGSLIAATYPAVNAELAPAESVVFFKKTNTRPGMSMASGDRERGAPFTFQS